MHLELNQVNLHLVHTLLIITGNHCRKKNLSTLSCVRSWVNTWRIIKYFPSPSLPSFSPFLSTLSPFLPSCFLVSNYSNLIPIPGDFLSAAQFHCMGKNQQGRRLVPLDSAIFSRSLQLSKLQFSIFLHARKR